MKITSSKQARRCVKRSTFVTNHNGEYMLLITSDYDDFHGWWEYHDMNINEDGDIVEQSSGGYITPADLIGDEIA